MIFKVSRLSVAELVKTFAQLLGTEGPPSSSVQGWVPCFFFTHENQNTEKDGGEKKSPVPSKRRILNLSFTSLGGEGRNKLYKWNSINLVILWIFLDDFKIHGIQLWIFVNLGELKAESEQWPWTHHSKCHSSRTGVSAPPEGNQSSVMWGIKNKSSSKPQVILNRTVPVRGSPTEQLHQSWGV